MEVTSPRADSLLCSSRDVPSVSKYRLSAASLVTAIPAGYLAYLLVMAFLQKPGFDKMPGFFQIISGLALTMVTLMVLMPVGILIFGAKPDKVEKTPKDDKDADAGEDLAVDEDEPSFEDDGEDADDAAEEMFGDDEEGDDFDDDGFDDFDDDEDLK